jgi:hypothetical protein
MLWSGDVLKLTQVGMKPINSPSRLVALQLANGNALFREILKRKLLESGGLTFQIPQFNTEYGMKREVKIKEIKSTKIKAQKPVKSSSKSVKKEREDVDDEEEEEGMKPGK